ncbi:MAG: hypothetical protein SWY16_25875 [Cyanobacteriota bacterium]|nr:hypothetical protein [Cyanobacteriota bacterium]
MLDALQKQTSTWNKLTALVASLDACLVLLFLTVARETDFPWGGERLVENYYILDGVLIGFFGLDFLARSFALMRQTPGINWFEAMLRRWYDIFLLLPFWRWLRLMPAMVRLHRAQVVNLEQFLAHITHEPAAYLADRVSEFVAVRMLNQAQSSIEAGELARAILEPQDYIRVNDVREMDEITDRLLRLTIYKVLPRVQPELRAILNYSLTQAFEQSAFYELLQQVLGVKGLPEEAMEPLSMYLAESVCDVLATSYADLEGKQRFDQLSQEFQKILKQELQNKETLAAMQQLLSDFLEEMKLNYVQKSARQDPTSTLQEVDRIHEKVESDI